MSIAISFDGFALDGSGGVRCETLREEGRADARTQKVVQGRGAAFTNQVFGEMRVRIGGTVHGSTQSEMLSRWTALKAAFNVNGLRPFVLDTSRELMAFVTRPPRLTPKRKAALVSSNWEAELTAPDPVYVATTASSKVVEVTGGTPLYTTVTNGGDAPGHWRCQVVTDTTFQTASLTLYNETSSRTLRLAGFGLTTAELGMIDTRRGGFFQESGAFPDDSFGIEVVDGDFFLLEPEVNRLRIVCDQDIILHFLWKDAYWGPG